MTYLWQEEWGKKYYKVQTDDREVARKMKRRNGFRLCGYAVNAAPGNPANGASGAYGTTSVWIFSCEFSRPDIAKKTLKSITGKYGKIDSEGEFFYE